LKNGYYVTVNPPDNKDKIDDMLYILKEIKQVEVRCPNADFTISLDEGMYEGFCITIKLK